MIASINVEFIGFSLLVLLSNDLISFSTCRSVLIQYLNFPWLLEKLIESLKVVDKEGKLYSREIKAILEKLSKLTDSPSKPVML
jgi:hypothetical protein